MIQKAKEPCPLNFQIKAIAKVVYKRGDNLGQEVFSSNKN